MAVALAAGACGDEAPIESASPPDAAAPAETVVEAPPVVASPDESAADASAETEPSEPSYTISLIDGAVAVAGSKDHLTGVADFEAVSGTTLTGQPRGLLRFGDLMEVELAKGGQASTPDLAQGADEVAFPFHGGHMNVTFMGAALEIHLGDQRTFRTTTPGTEFSMCFAPDEGNACLWVKKGEVTWINDGGYGKTFGEGQGTRYTDGQGTFALGPDGKPEPTRCDPVQAGQQWIEDIRKGVDRESLPELVDTWPECDRPSFPSSQGMLSLSFENPAIGAVGTPAGTIPYLEQTAVDGPIHFFADSAPVSNAELLAWIAARAGTDAETWRSLVPQTWLNEAQFGQPTRSTYPVGTGAEPAEGASWQVASAYCEDQIKHLITEVEWELAFASGALEFPAAGTREWVSDWGTYAAGVEPGAVVIRGNDNTGAPDLYYRNAVIDSSASRRGTRIRCTAPSAQIPREPFPIELDADEFLELGGWPEHEDDLFSLAYHDPDVYHLEARSAHTRGAVTKRIDGAPLEAATLEAELFVARSRMGAAPGTYRFGLLLGDREHGVVLATLQPNVSDGTHHLCVSTLDRELESVLATGGYAWRQDDAHPHVLEDCTDALASVILPVADVDAPVLLALRFDGGQAIVLVEGRELARVPWPGSMTLYGFYAENYDKDVSHIHLDGFSLEAPT